MYRCIKGFSIEKYDDDGLTIEGEYIEIKEGTIWNIPKENYRFIGGEIRLENDDLEWVELSKESIEKCFVRVVAKAIEFDENDMNICPVCKRHVMTDDKFCKYCGQRIELI